ncbi:MAG: CsbD family protein [Acidimicrobiales bacterium]
MAGTKDQIKAKIHEVTGRSKTVAGKAGHSNTLRAKGTVGKVKGSVEETVARLEHAVEDFRQNRPTGKA